MIIKENFDKLPPHGKRIMIALDVISRVEAGNLIAFRGSLFGGWQGTDEFKETTSAQDHINQLKGCKVCAKGALVCSWVGNFNHYSPWQIHGFDFNLKNHNSYPEELIEIFGREMLDDIEAAFESKVFGWNIRFHDLLNEDAFLDPMYYMIDDARYGEWNQERKIYSEFEGDLAAIMRHIVANHGEFPFDYTAARNRALAEGIVFK